MDADFSHDPAVLPSILAPLAEGFDLSIGSRYVKGGAIPNLVQVIKQRRANYCSVQLLRLSQAYMGISADDMAQMRNNVTIEFASDPNYISETEFPEVYGLDDLWPPRW